MFSGWRSSDGGDSTYAETCRVSSAFRTPSPFAGKGQGDEVQSVLVPGEYDHFLWPLCNIVPELDVKLSKKDAYKVKVKFSLRPSPYALNAAGNGCISFCDTADAAATS